MIDSLAARCNWCWQYTVKGGFAKSVPKTVPFTRELGPTEVKYAESIYPAVQESISDGLYLPRRASRLCSRKYSLYWESCQREFGRKVTTT